jgi:ribonuclease III
MSLDDLQVKLGITFLNPQLLQTAFIHRSHLNEAKHLRSSNERLEFLGDAVLSFLTSEFLYKTYPEYPEGTLTNVRSSLVKTQSLAAVAKKLSLGDLLKLSHGEEASGGRNNNSLLADAFEALLGALYLDQGVEPVRKLLTTFLFSEAASIVQNKSYVDYKSLFQEIVQQESRVSPTYQVIKSEGPDHAKTFWVSATVAGVSRGEGKGHSKQEAEQQAAKNALEKMGK